MERGLDLREELGLEFKIDDFIRRHMSDMQVPGPSQPAPPIAPKPPRPIERQYSMQRPPAYKPLNFTQFGDTAEPIKEPEASNPTSSEPKLSELERYRPPPPRPKSELVVSVPVSLSNSCLASPIVRLEATQPHIFRAEERVPEKAKVRDPLEFPEAPPFLMILGVGGVCVRLQNRESDYTHGISVSNVRGMLRDWPVLRFLKEFPGPLEAASPLSGLFNYCTSRAKHLYLWEILGFQLTSGASLLDENTSEELKAARSGVISCLQALPRPSRPVLSPFAPAAPATEAVEENALLIKAGNLEEALTHALATRNFQAGIWTQAFMIAGLMGSTAAFHKVLSAYTAQAFTRSDGLYILGMLVGGNIGNLLVTQEAAEDWAGNVCTVLSNFSLIGTSTGTQFLHSLAETLDFRVSYK